MSRLEPLWCIGGAVWDRKLRLLAPAVAGSSNPVQESANPGGVARNVAHNLALLGLPVALLSAWGDDERGRLIAADCARLGLGLDAVLHLAGTPSGSYTAVLGPDGDLQLGLAQLDALQQLDPDALARSAAVRRSSPLQLADMNLRADTLAAWLAEPRDAKHRGSALLLAVSEPKMAALPEDLSRLDLLIANAGEWQAAGGNTELARRGLRQALISQGAAGLRCGRWQDGQWQWQRLEAEPLDTVLDATGAGDALAAGVAAALVQGVTDLATAARFGQQLSRRCLQSLHSVAPDIHPGLLAELENPYA